MQERKSTSHLPRLEHGRFDLAIGGKRKGKTNSALDEGELSMWEITAQQLGFRMMADGLGNKAIKLEKQRGLAGNPSSLLSFLCGKIW